MNTKKIQPRKAADVTPEVIKAWKEAHPRGIWQVSIDGDDPADKEAIKTGYLRKPSREELASFMTSKDANPLDVAEGLLRDCWLGGDEELLDDFDYFQGAVTQFQELMKVRTGEIKKL